MPKETVKMPKYTCNRCGSSWIPRDADRKPIACARCNSPYWDTPREAKPARSR